MRIMNYSNSTLDFDSKVALAAFTTMAQLNVRKTVFFIMNQCGIPVKSSEIEQDRKLSDLSVFSKKEFVPTEMAVTMTRLLVFHQVPFYPQ